MSSRIFAGGVRKGAVAATAVGLVVSAWLVAQGQDVPPPTPAPDLGSSFAPDDDQQTQEGIETQIRGPVHEAFASPMAADPLPGPIAPKQPPEPIEEATPDEQPEGNNVVWLPGYWAWDEERDDFIWVSGLWRNAPPRLTWVPGYWSQVSGGYQWTPGLWTQAAGGEVNYLPEKPPESLDQGPSSPAPSQSHFWIPGCWNYQQTRYVWRPGYWAVYQPNWVWVPAHYSWCPGGYVFVDGYWDYEFDRRGCLFAPVYFSRPVYLAPAFVYRPTVVFNTRFFTTHWFARPSHCHYYVGDYYAARYSDFGYRPWFSLTVNFGRSYDPLCGHYRWRHSRHDPDFFVKSKRRYEHLRDHDHDRPPHTFKAQKELLAKTPERDRRSRTDLVAAETIKEASRRDDIGVKLRPVSQDKKRESQDLAGELKKVARERAKIEKGDGDDRGERGDVTRARPSGRNTLKLPNEAVVKTTKLDDRAIGPGAGRQGSGRQGKGRPTHLADADKDNRDNAARTFGGRAGDGDSAGDGQRLPRSREKDAAGSPFLDEAQDKPGDTAKKPTRDGRARIAIPERGDGTRVPDVVKSDDDVKPGRTFSKDQDKGPRIGGDGDRSLHGKSSGDQPSRSMLPPPSDDSNRAFRQRSGAGGDAGKAGNNNPDGTRRPYTSPGQPSDGPPKVRSFDRGDSGKPDLSRGGSAPSQRSLQGNDGGRPNLSRGSGQTMRSLQGNEGGKPDFNRGSGSRSTGGASKKEPPSTRSFSPPPSKSSSPKKNDSDEDRPSRSKRSDAGPWPRTDFDIQRGGVPAIAELGRSRPPKDDEADEEDKDENSSDRPRRTKGEEAADDKTKKTDRFSDEQPKARALTAQDEGSAGHTVSPRLALPKVKHAIDKRTGVATAGELPTRDAKRQAMDDASSKTDRSKVNLDPPRWPFDRYPSAPTASLPETPNEPGRPRIPSARELLGRGPTARSTQAENQQATDQTRMTRPKNPFAAEEPATKEQSARGGPLTDQRNEEPPSDLPFPGRPTLDPRAPSPFAQRDAYRRLLDRGQTLSDSKVKTGRSTYAPVDSDGPAKVYSEPGMLKDPVTSFRDSPNRQSYGPSDSNRLSGGSSRGAMPYSAGAAMPSTLRPKFEQGTLPRYETGGLPRLDRSSSGGGRTSFTRSSPTTP